MGGILGGSSGGGTSTNTVTSSGPPAYLQPYLTTLAANAQAAQNHLTAPGGAGAGTASLQNPFQGQVEPGAGNPAGQLVAPFTPLQQQGQAAATATAGNVANNIQPQSQMDLNQIAQMMQPGANGLNSFQNTANSFQPLSTSALQSAIQADIVPTTQQYQEQIIPQITDQAVQQGAYGGTRAQTVQNQAARDYTQSINNIAGQMTYANEEQQNSNMLQNVGNEIQGNAQTLSAANLIPQLGSAAEQQGLDVSNILNTTGATQQSLTQQQIAAAGNEYAGLQNAPYVGMSQLEAALGIGGGGTSTSTVTPSTSAFGNLAAGALGLGAFANSGIGSGLINSVIPNSGGSGLQSIFDNIFSTQAAAPVSFL